MKAGLEIGGCISMGWVEEKWMELDGDGWKI